jgi:hypothetical protein
MHEEINKFPRTPHTEGSKLQPGDDGSDQASLSEIRKAHPGCRFYVYEKIDGANSATSFNDDLVMRLQSRGHYLTGGARESQFNLLKEWARSHEGRLMERLENRYTLYHEWMFARHTMFYDRLPHYAVVIDVLDRETGAFLGHEARRDLLSGLPLVEGPLLADDWPENRKALLSLVQGSSYRSENWRENLNLAATQAGIDPQKALEDCGRDPDLMEGLYIKIEKDDRIVARYKWVRPGFVQTLNEGGVHWSQRPMIRNMLSDGVDIFASPEDPAP